jgi:uncharacterized protein YdgA (DUF945 family)
VTVFNPAPGGGTSDAQTFMISDSLSGTWTQTDWAGGGGQLLWADATRYDSASGIDDSVNGEISLASTSTVLFSDDFTRPPDSPDPLSPWVASMGTWTVSGGVMQGSASSSRQYAYAYYSPTPVWSDYTVQGRIQMPTKSFGGGIGGRVDPATGAHYGVWVYPKGSSGGSNLLKLWKFRSWTDMGAGVPMQQVSLPAVGTDWHTLRMSFLGNRILVYYDGVLMIDVTDNNFDSSPPYSSGGISADWWTGTAPQPKTITVDDIYVVTLPGYESSGVLLSSAFDGWEGVQWQSVSWDAAAGGSTNVCVRTRTADLADQLAGASWSDCYGNSGSGFMGVNRRWIQYQLELTTSDPSTSPVFDEVRITYLPGTPGDPVPVITTLVPASVTAGGPGFTLTVNGSDFITGSMVRWNGTDRVTTFVSATQVTATISAADITVAGTAQVTVFNPAPGGGISNDQTFTIDNPVPTTTDLSPVSATAGEAAFILTVTGSGFVTGSVVQWNGLDRTTTYVSPTELTASITAADIAAAGTAQVTVFNLAPGGGMSNAQVFTITIPDNPVPGITSLSPLSATMGGAAFTLIVNGTDFITSSMVRWNGTDRTTTYLSPTQLTAAISAEDIAVAGTASVTVFNPAPGGGTSNAQTFTISAVNNPVPATTGLSPSSATAGGPAFTLTVNGSNFVTDSVVQWNGSSRTTTYVSPTELTAAIPAADMAVAGTALVTVFNPAPGGGVSNAQTFTITVSDNPIPTISSLSPSSATAGGAAFTLTVNGSDFVSDSVIRWNGTDRTTTYVSATQVTAAITSEDIAAAGTASVTVFNPAPGGGTSNAQTFTINNPDNPVPTTTGLSPASAIAGGPDFTLTVNGSGYMASSVVRWNGADRATTYISSTQLTAAITASDIATAGTAQVTVFNPAPGGGTSNAQTFTINNPDNPVPTTTGLSPASATAGGPDFTLTVNGTGYVASSVVRWNGADRTTTYVSSSQLTAAITAADIATAGTAQVTVFNPAPGGGTSNPQTFTISAVNNPVPTTTSLTPAFSTAGGVGFTLTVHGTGFINGSVVQWNGSDRTTTFVSTIQLTAAISAADIASAGTAQVTVFNPAPGGGTSNAQTFTINNPDNPVPTTIGLSPSSTTAGGSAFTLTISGSGFITGSVVQWNGSSRTTTYISSAQLSAAISAEDIAVAGTASVTVFNPAPGGGASNAQIFTINATSTVLFSDDFTRLPDSPDPLSPWVASMGTWTVTGGVMQGTGPARQYSYASLAAAPQWTDYTVQGLIQIPAGSFGGGIGGRVDAATGAHYGAWVYPTGSPGGSNLLKLWKFRSWTDIGGGVPMQQVNLPAVGTGWHTLQMTFTGNRILVYYDGVLRIDVTDNNYDSRAPYLSGGISMDWWTWSLPYTITVDDISVVTQ